MATRLPYYTGEDDIYSRLMAQYSQELPYYTSAPVDVSGGYDASLYARPAAPMPNRLPGASGLLFEMGPGSGEESNAAWSNLSPGQQAAYYAANPMMGKITQTMQGLFGMTPLGALQRATNPDFVRQQQMIARGIDPFGMAGLSPQEQANVNQALSSYLESSMNQPAEAAAPTVGYDTGGFGAYGENVAPVDTGVVVGGPIGPQGAIGTDLGLLSDAAVSGGAPAPGAIDGGYGAYGENVAPSGDGGGGGDGGSKMICTKLHELGKMPEEIFVADQAFGALMAKDQPETYDGYAVWARHVVRWMSREDWIGKAVVGIVHTIATPWSVAMAEQMGVNVKSNWFGRLLMTGGLQVCKMIGKMTHKGSLKNVW